MPLNQMRFNLTHRVQHDTDNNEQTRAAKKLRGYRWHVQTLAQQTREHCYDREEDRACERQTRHGVIEKIRSWLPGSDTRNVTAIFLKIVCDLRWLKLGRDPKIAEEENHRSQDDVMQPSGRKHF